MVGAMIAPRLIESMRQSDIGQRLIRQANFHAAATASGSFMPDNEHDDWRLGRTSAWVAQHSIGMWRRSVDQPAGRVSFEFEDAADAEAFRVAAATLAGMIPCR